MQMDANALIDKAEMGEFSEDFKQKNRCADPAAIQKEEKVRSYLVCRSIIAGNQPTLSRMALTTGVLSQRQHLKTIYRRTSKPHLECLKLPRDEIFKCHSAICPWLFKS